MKVAIYCRVSSEEQSIEKQEALCREYCQRENYEIFAVYKDDGFSGMKTSRPAFDQMLIDMRARKFNCIMVTKLDRIGRSLQHILSLVEEFTKKGINFVTVTQSINFRDPVMGKLTLSIFGAFAEFERNIISERTKEGLKYAVGTGKRGKDKKPRKKGGSKSIPLVVREKVTV